MSASPGERPRPPGGRRGRAQAHEVGVEEHDDLGVGRRGDAGPHRLALARRRLVHHPGAVGGGHGGGAVGRRVVDDDDVVDEVGVERGVDHRADGRGLVPGRDDGCDGRIGRETRRVVALVHAVDTLTGRRHRLVCAWCRTAARPITGRRTDALTVTDCDGSSDPAKGGPADQRRQGGHDVRMNWMRLIAVLRCFAVVVAACSSDRGDDPDASADDGRRTTRTGRGRRRGRPTDGFGTLESPCGEGDGGPAPATRASPRPDRHRLRRRRRLPAVARPQPREADAIEAMIDWCNEQGGINGREVVGNYYDAKHHRRRQRHDPGAAARCSCSSARAGRSTRPRRRPAWAATCRRCPTYSVSPEFANAPLT